MRFYKRIKSALKCKSGASIIFVLGIMMFLMAIGVSTMAAAASNAGALIKQNEYSRIKLLDKSIHDNIMFSLQADPGNTDLLGYQLAEAIFKAHDSKKNGLATTDPDYVPPLDTITDMAIIINSDDGAVYLYNPDPVAQRLDKIHVNSVIFRFPVQEIVDSPEIEFDPIYRDDGDGLILVTPPRIPRTVTINARMVVDVEITARDLRTAGNDRHITSRAVYEYRNGRLSENPFPGEDGTYEMRFDIDGYGVWELVSYEIIEG